MSADVSKLPQHGDLYDVDLLKKSIFEPHHTHANVFCEVCGRRTHKFLYLRRIFTAFIETSGEHAERIYVGRAGRVKLIRNLYARPCADSLS